jgi:hypothetical protein
MATITVTVDQEVADILRRGGERSEAIVRDSLDELGDAFVSHARPLAGAGPYGQSFSSHRSGDSAVVAGSTSPLAAIIERGRKPGRRPPGGDRRTTSGRGLRLGNSAADRIARSGTKGRYIVKKSAAQVRSDGTLSDVVRRVVIRITEG